MIKQVQLYYNPYIPQLDILLDGKQPSDFSILIQYMDEDIWNWCNNILDDIYSELREEFSILFIGTEADAEVMRLKCNEFQYCKSISVKGFMIDDSLQKRLVFLNNFIKKKDKIYYEKAVIKAFFAVDNSLKKYNTDIADIRIKNVFCEVKSILCSSETVFEIDDNSFLFIISDNFNNAVKKIESFTNRNTQKPCFAIFIGNTDRIFHVNETVYVYETICENLLDTIFKCFLMFPLLNALRNCIKSLPDNVKSEKDIQKLLSVEPIISVDLSDVTEINTSSRITVSSEPPMGRLPKLEFKVMDFNIAETDGLYLFGKKEGTTKLEVYRYGAKKPFLIKDIKIINRNRIKKIVLDDRELILGVGNTKTMKYEFFPNDADNCDKLCWKSTNEKIITVDKNGNITALSQGKCKVIISAENVSASCYCIVKPYLEKIDLNLALDENEILRMKSMDEVIIDFRLIPEDCFDCDIMIGTSDFNVVNIINNVLVAKNNGEALITLSNENKNVKKEIKVIVSDKISDKVKKDGILKSFFKKIKA